MDVLNEQFSNLQVEDREDLIIVAITFMGWGRECVMAWSEQEKRLVRPVTNLETNSWDSGTFIVGRTYEFVICNRNPESDKPHKNEDILVKESPIPRDGQLDETEMYIMLEPSSKISVPFVFFPLGAIKNKKYIEKSTDCPSAGIMRCTVASIRLYMDREGKDRCKINRYFDFPMKARNIESLKTGLQNCRPDDGVLVLLGLARRWRFYPDRCYIMVIGIIRERHYNFIEPQRYYQLHFDLAVGMQEAQVYS